MAQKHSKDTRRPGSVRWRENRQRYEARVRLPNGARPSAYFEDEKDAWTWIAMKLTDAKRGRFIAHDTIKTSTALQEWFETVAGPNLRENSRYTYGRCIEYVLPWIGGIKLRDLKRPHIERALAGLEHADGDRRGLSRSTLNLTFRVLKAALEYCVDAEYIVRNPMARMRAPRVLETKDRVLSIEEIEAILAEAHGTRWHATFAVLAATGMRPSEVLGLEWHNVDLDRGIVKVERQTGRIYGKPGVHLMSLKTETAQRALMVPPGVRDILRWHRDVQRIERRQGEKEGRWKECGLVFCHPNGTPYSRMELDAEMRRVTRRLGIDEATPHTFRHTVTTMLQELGVPLKATQRVLGHATERTTVAVYSHAGLDAAERAAAAMEGVFGDAPALPPTWPLTAERRS